MTTILEAVQHDLSALLAPGAGTFFKVMLRSPLGGEALDGVTELPACVWQDAGDDAAPHTYNNRMTTCQVTVWTAVGDHLATAEDLADLSLVARREVIRRVVGGWRASPSAGLITDVRYVGRTQPVVDDQGAPIGVQSINIEIDVVEPIDDPVL